MGSGAQPGFVGLAQRGYSTRVRNGGPWSQHPNLRRARRPARAPGGHGRMDWLGRRSAGPLCLARGSIRATEDLWAVPRRPALVPRECRESSRSILLSLGSLLAFSQEWGLAHWCFCFLRCWAPAPIGAHLSRGSRLTSAPAAARVGGQQLCREQIRSFSWGSRVEGERCPTQ
ncbi:hypothetical protein NDU88_003920 [Pleurodeles waltl]|uniref:Uncharacterized protein n=1 Tax=Pleurodeles waltl TaxID=8319 RepID=A0AAV7TQH4_PLEWA|nr:hypothetical protein NDU88_003920 [Pleurodeles waltl]